MAVAPRAAVARNVLDYRQHASGNQPLRRRAAQRGHLIGGVAISAVADDLVTVGRRHVQHRHAVDIDRERGQVVGQQARSEEYDVAAQQGVVGRQLPIGPARRETPPVRRPQPLLASALLIDQDRRVGALDTGAQLLDQAAQLVRRLDIAFEDDEAPGPHIGEAGRARQALSLGPAQPRMQAAASALT